MNKDWQIIEVEARFDLQGQVTPISLVSEGRRVGLSCGRRWQDQQGLHILVMGPDDRVLELLFAPAELQWYCKKLSGDWRVA